MNYSILIFAPDSVFERLPQEEQDAYMQSHRDLQAELAAQGKFATARLMPASHAVTVKPTAGPNQKPLVVDGPFAETKEHFMGFYIVDCDRLEEAIDMASRLATPHNHIEVRPVAWAGGVLGE